MELFVVVIDNLVEDEIGPVAYLVGGPGGAAHSEVDWLRHSPSDVVLVEAWDRASTPFLACPELDEIRTQQFALGYTADADALGGAALADCSARLANQGVDVALFDSEANARDFETVRTALGYDQWNLWGGSYGARLGLEILRLHPETVRAAVFESVPAPQADLAAEWPDHFRNSLDLLVEGCAVSPNCDDTYGDLDAVLNQLVEQLDAQPVDVEIRGNTIRMDGAALAATVLDALFDTETIPRLPFLLTAAAGGDLVPLAEIRAGWLNPDPEFSWGMYMSVQCRDHYSVTDEDAMNTALADETGGFTRVFTYSFYTETRRQWGAGTSPSSTRDPVTSDVPTLLMAGQFDPGTPRCGRSKLPRDSPTPIMSNSPAKATT